MRNPPIFPHKISDFPGLKVLVLNSIAVAGNERSVNMTHASSASAAQRCTSAGRVEEPIKEEDKEVPSIMRADLYTEGQNRELDKKYLAYKKMNIWRGPAVSGALRGDEVDTLVDLWKKEKICPWKMSVQDVLAIVAFSERIFAWRKNVSREKTRIRAERARDKLREAVKKGDAKAIKRVRKIKKADALKSAKYRRRKREEAGNQDEAKAVRRRKQRKPIKNLETVSGKYRKRKQKTQCREKM